METRRQDQTKIAPPSCKFGSQCLVVGDTKTRILKPLRMDFDSLNNFAFCPDVSFEEMQAALVDAGMEIEKMHRKSETVVEKLKHVQGVLSQLADELRDKELEAAQFIDALRKVGRR
jgi:uncharacterized coiled-coil protein SlyX